MSSWPQECEEEKKNAVKGSSEEDMKGMRWFIYIYIVAVASGRHGVMDSK